MSLPMKVIRLHALSLLLMLMMNPALFSLHTTTLRLRCSVLRRFASKKMSLRYTFAPTVTPAACSVDRTSHLMTFWPVLCQHALQKTGSFQF